MKRIFLLFVLSACIFCKVKAQTRNVIAPKKYDTVLVENQVKLIDSTKKANSLKTGQAHNLLTNFYQLAIKNAFGDKKELSYSSTIFGLLKARAYDTSKYTIDSNYIKKRWTRNIQVSISGRIDTNNNIASYGGGVKFYLMNKRDVSDKNGPFQKQMDQFVFELQKDLGEAMRKCRSSSRRDLIFASKEKYNKTFNIKDLDPELVDTLKKMRSKVVLGKGLADSAKSYFDQQIKLIKKKPLWSIGGSYLHSIQNKSDTTTIQSDFLVGLKKGKTDKFWEFNISTYLQLFNSRIPQSTSSQKFHFETGLNKILSENSAGESNMELKFFGSYDKGFNTTTIPTTTAANLTYRYLVSRLGGFWIPVTLSYDPGKGKFLGFIDLTFNIDPKK